MTRGYPGKVEEEGQNNGLSGAKASKGIPTVEEIRLPAEAKVEGTQKWKE